ncbi:MAG: V-type ATP synthase subunit E family protein [Promethearchaeota archaeon]
MDSGINDIRLHTLKIKVLDEARKKAEKIARDAEVKNLELEKEAMEEVSYLENKRGTTFSEEQAKAFTNKKGQLMKDKAKQILKFKQGKLNLLIEDVVKQFIEKLENNTDFYFGTIFNQIISNVLQYTSFNEYKLIVNSKDYEYLKAHPEFLEKFNKTFHLIKDSSLNGDFGCIIEDKNSSVKFDNLLSKTLEFKKNSLITKLSPILFNEN